MKDALIVTALSVVPKNLMARWMGSASRLRLPGWAHRALLSWFCSKYKVDLSECEGGIEDYASLADFFVRPLKAGMRPIDPDPALMVSPVDARAHTVGRVEGGTFLQYEGKRSSVAALLGISAEEARRYEGGPFAVLYLCPTDYHRVHVPLESQISTWRYQPGTLWPVFPTATRKVEELFANNERLVFDLDTDFGRVGQVMVGAFGVGRMTTVLGPGATNDSQGFARSEPRSTRLERGAELGRFELGSTVILVGEPGRFEWLIQPGQPVRLGRPIARRC